MTLCGLDSNECVRFSLLKVYDQGYFGLATSTVLDDVESDIQLDILQVDIVYKLNDRDMVVWCEFENGARKLYVGVPDPEKVIFS